MKTIYLDRSRIQDELECKRLRFLRYDAFNGESTTGVEPAKKSLPLVNGSFIHETLEAIRKGAGVEDTLQKQEEVYKQALGEDDKFLLEEQLALLRGLVYAWVDVRLPQIEAEYELVLVEQEVQWELHKDDDYQLIVMLKCDTLERSRQDGELYIREYKTTGESDKEAWRQRFERSSQLICNILGMSEALKLHINGALIEGLDKGFRAKDKAQKSAFYGKKIQCSPLCYGYKNGTGYSTGFNKGALKCASWQEMPAKKWVMDVLTPEDRADLFLAIPPIYFNDKLLQDWKIQTIAKELRYARSIDCEETIADPLNLLFPQNLNHCRRFHNNPCSMEYICFMGIDPKDPILYKPRVPHHALPGESDD